MNKELKQAIEKLNNLIKNANVEDIDMNDIFGGEHIEAINTVLKELDNSISKDKIENKIKELKEKLENVKNKEDRIRNGIAVIALEYCIDSINELLNKE